MKAGSLWPGTDYAYEEYRGRGRPLPLDAKCVKVLELVQEPIPGGKRSRTKVLVAFMDDEGGAITEGFDSVPRFVKAEDIINFWEDYEEDRREAREERDRRREEDRIRTEQRRKEREEHDAINAVAWFIRNAGIAIETHKRHEAERLRLEQEANYRRRIRNVLITRGFKAECIQFNGMNILIELQEMERWLGIESESTKQRISNQPS